MTNVMGSVSNFLQGFCIKKSVVVKAVLYLQAVLGDHVQDARDAKNGGKPLDLLP